MILQALVKHYEDLMGLGLIAPPGWGDSNISFALFINSDGELQRAVDIRQPQKKGKPKPQAMRLPSSPTGRTSSAVKPAFLWDNAKYLLGIDSEGKQQRYFDGTKKFYRQLLDGVDTPAAKALLAFFHNWNPERAAEHPAIRDQLDSILAGANLVFRFQGSFVHEDPAIRQAWQNHYDADSDGPTMICLVSGQETSAEAIHPPIKGVQGAQPSGAALVSFNAHAFCSYGKEQNLNAPTGKYASFAYTSALNHLLADREHLCRISDTTVICWAEGGEPAFQDAFGAFAFGSRSSYTETELRGMVKKLLCGDSVLFDDTLLNPDKPFYILGLAPNAARLSVRFFLRDSFGSFLKNVQSHYGRLEIVKPSYDRFDSLPLWKLLGETVRQKKSKSIDNNETNTQNFRDNSPSPNMAGAVLRSVLMDEPYPATLLHGALLRIRAEREVTRGRAAILKAYYLKRPHPDIPKEVLTVSLNPDSTNIPYTLGRLFSVLEDIQRKSHGPNATINATIKDRYFNAASSTPGHIFPILLDLSQKHLRKLEGGLRVYYEKQIAGLIDVLPEKFPPRLNLPQQGSFQLGYYHQTQKRYEKKEEIKNV